MRLVISFSLLVLILGLAGCVGGTATTQGGGKVPVEDRSANNGSQAMEGEGAMTWGIGEGVPYQGDPLADPASLLAQRVFYFEFDSSEIQDSDRPAIEAHGRYLARHPGVEVTLEGHTDERGSREYNLALGERRAKAVSHLILLMGASPDQVKIVSYGEERPAMEGHNESAWKFNRRVEIIYPEEQ